MDSKIEIKMEPNKSISKNTIDAWTVLRFLSASDFAQAKTEALKDILKLAFKHEQENAKREQLMAARPADTLAETVRKSWATHFGTNITHDLAVFNPKIMSELKYGEKPLEIAMEKFRGHLRQRMITAGFTDASEDDTPMSDESQKVKISKSASQMISKYQNQIDMNESMNGPETTSSSGFTSQLNSSLSRNFSSNQPGSSSPISNPQQQTDEIR